MVLSKKKILWISHFLPFPVKSGAQIRSFNLLKQLASYHEVSLFCIVQESVVKNYFSSVEAAIAEAKLVFSEFCNDVIFYVIRQDGKYEKIKDLVLSFVSSRSYGAQRIYHKDIKMELLAFVDKIDPESIHLDTVGLGVYLDLFKERSVILNHHNIESVMMDRRAKETSNLLLKIICKLDSIKIRLMESKISSQTAKHLVCSELDRQRLLAVFPKSDVVVVPNGIDCSKINYERDPRAYKLLFIGGLDWYPNVDAIRYFLKNIWPSLIKEFPGLSIDIVGKCPPSDLIAYYKNDKSVCFHGFVNDIRVFYKENWVYVCPIMDGGGTKLKVLDAMANGILLMANPVAMEGIDAKPGVHYFPAVSAGDYLEVFRQLSSSGNKALIDSMESAARELIINKYNYEKIGITLMQSY
jgi:glycosyltransferase involved in cell wall biosynthesis